MCRTIGEGGRRCGCAGGTKRRGADRARYARSKAIALNRGAGSGSGGASISGQGGGGSGGNSDNGSSGGGTEPETLGGTIGDNPLPVDESEVMFISGGGDAAGQSYDQKINELRQESRDALDAVKAYEDFHTSKGEIGAYRQKLWDEEGLSTSEAEIRTAEEFGIDLSPDFDVKRTMIEATAKLTQAGETLHEEVVFRLGGLDDPAERLAELETALSEAMRSMLNPKLSEEERGEQGSLFNELGLEKLKLKEYAPAEWQNDYASMVQTVLSEFRDMGTTNTGIHRKSEKPAAEAVKDAAKFFPTEWWEMSKAHDKPLYARHTQARAHYVTSDRRSFVADSATKERFKTPEVEEKVHVDNGKHSDVVEQFLESLGMKHEVYDPVLGGKYRRKLVNAYLDDNGEVVTVYTGGMTSVAYTKEETRVLGEDHEMMPFVEYKTALHDAARLKGDWKTYTTSEDGTAVLTHTKTGALRKIACDRELAPPKERTTRVGTLTTDKSLAVTVHELAHRMESVNPEIVKLEEAYWAQRCTNPDTNETHEGVSLKGYIEGNTQYRGKRNEIGYPDAKFSRVYSSKRYKTGHHELLSTGCDAIFGKRDGSLMGLGNGKEADDSHRNWTIGMLLVA